MWESLKFSNLNDGFCGWKCTESICSLKRKIARVFARKQQQGNNAIENINTQEFINGLKTSWETFRLLPEPLGKLCRLEDNHSLMHL